MDFVCAMLFHSNVNKVSPNRTILAGEKVGIAWLLPNEPGVYWYGVFSQLFCGYDLCRFEHAYIALHVMLTSLCKKYFAMKTSFPVLCSDSWSQCPAPTDSPRGVGEILQRVLQTHPCASDCRIRAFSHQQGTDVLLPSQARPVKDDLQAATAAAAALGCFQSLLFFPPVGREL